MWISVKSWLARCVAMPAVAHGVSVKHTHLGSRTLREINLDALRAP